MKTLQLLLALGIMISLSQPVSTRCSDDNPPNRGECIGRE